MIQPRPDDIIEIDCRGTRVRTTRRIIAKGEGHPGLARRTLYRLFDPKCGEYLTPESDGSVKIDSHPALIQHLVSWLDCESKESTARLRNEFEKKYDINLISQWVNEFQNKYRT